MAQAHHPARWAVAALIVAIVGLGAALLTTAWLSHARVGTAADVLARGQAATLYEQVAHALVDARELTPAVLAEVQAALADDGLRYLAVAGARGRILASAGVAVGRAAPDQARPGELVVLGERIRVVYRRPPRRQGAALAARAPFVVLEFDDRVTAGLRGSTRTALWLGALAALTCLAAASFLGRWLAQREARARAGEQARRLASLGEMSATLAHELRNPLASLKGNAQLLARMLPEGERPRAKAERVVGEAERLEALTDDLLAFARTGSLRPVEGDPAALVREVVASSSAADRVQVDVAAAPATWRVDPARLRQVLANLVDNALRAGDGAVRLTVAARGGALELRVRDHGPGIAPEDLPRLFEPFFTRRTQGTGLGLAVARRLVELHGGSITAHNADGGGAEFVVRLPA